MNTITIDGNHYQPLIPQEGSGPESMVTQPMIEKQNLPDPSLQVVTQNVNNVQDSNLKTKKTSGSEAKASLVPQQSKSEPVDAKAVLTDAKSSVKASGISDTTPQKKEESKQEESETKKKDDKIPNSLIIYIKTRIPNFYKFNYEPYMSVPKNKSHTVYFDPLVKYYEGPIKNLPSGAPKDALQTQFFEASEFDSMINRILSDFRYMQKPRTFQESYDEHVIENNLRITLKNLFKTNNLFYINKKPYTIVGVKSNPSDWQIDKKPLEKLLNQFSHLSVKQLQDEANKEEDDIPEILRQGNVASYTIFSDENRNVVADGLKKASDNHDTKTLEKEIKGVTDEFVPKKELPGVSEDILNLYSKYLRQNIPINYSNAIDLARDPLTLSLLVEPADLLDFINKNKNKNTKLVELYSTFTNSKIDLQQADKSYIDLCIELAKYKTNFDSEVMRIYNLILNKIGLLKINEQKKRIQDLMREITELKVGYMKIIFKIANAINEIYEKQHVYFVSTKALLEGLKKDYINIIKYYEKPELALKCIDNDIANMNSLIEEDPENPYSVSYYKNYNTFKKFYDNQLNEKRQQLLEPRINFADEAEIYIKQPNVLLIEKEQYEVYNFKMFLSYSYNQFDIWVLLFKSIDLFIRFIGIETSNIISLSDSAIQELNSTYTLEEQNTFLTQTGATGLRPTWNEETKKVEWFLTKDDGTALIGEKTEKPNPKKEKKSWFNKSNKQQEQEKKSFEELYIEYIKTSVKAYDAIILYIYLLEIRCLRQNRVYVAEENVNQLNLEYSLTLDQYFNIIVKSISENTDVNQLYIPSSLLWDTTNYDNIDVVNNKKVKNDKSNIIYRARLKSIAESRENLVSSCEEISNIITPNISRTGFITQCNNIISSQTSNITQHTFKSSYWIDKTIKNYDIQGTNDFIYNMNKVVKDAWYDRIIDDISVKSYLDWMVFDNDKDDIESLYAAVADGLNRQLALTDNETTNPYTVIIDGQRLFTADTIKQLVIDINDKQDIPSDLTDHQNNIIILEKTLKIKFIIFGMFNHNLPITIGDMVLYKGKPHRLLSIKTTEDGTEVYDLYNSYTEIKNVPQKKVKVNPNNFLQNFRIFCSNDAHSSDVEFTDYMYIVITKHKKDETKNDEVDKYQLVKDINTPFIFTEDKIPIYIKYLIFNSCPGLDKEVLTKMGFGNPNVRDDILYFETKRRESIEQENIRDDISSIEYKIKQYRNKYKNLKDISDKSLEQQAQELLYKEEIKDLKQRKKMLEEFLTEENMSGGANTIRPSQQYVSYMPQYNSSGYPLNQNSPGNVIYLPDQGYPYQNSYSRQYRVPYNVAQNKEKEQKSKLSFYITIELELFPGTSANTLQKSVVKCQSTFERIREAWSDIFGFQYRPAPMNEAYAYNLQQKDYNKPKTEKNRKTEKNKTRKSK